MLEDGLSTIERTGTKVARVGEAMGVKLLQTFLVSRIGVVLSSTIALLIVVDATEIDFEETDIMNQIGKDTTSHTIRKTIFITQHAESNRREKKNYTDLYEHRLCSYTTKVIFD